MPEIMENHPSVSSERRNTEGKLKLLRSKSRLGQNTENKSKDNENGTAKRWKRAQLKKSNIPNQDSVINLSENSDLLNDSSTANDIKPIIKSDNSEPNQNGGIQSVPDDNSPKTALIQEENKEIKRVTKKDSEKKVVLPKDLTRLSIDDVSEASVEGVVQSTSVAVPIERPRSVITQNDSWIRSAIPYLPLNLAVIYLILNIVLPGSGTILSGFSILCCGKCRVQTKDDERLVTLCVNVCVGVSQLFTITFLLVGWFWSIAWGVTMVTLAVELNRREKQQREHDLQVLALSAFNNPVQVRSLFAGKN